MGSFSEAEAMDVLLAAFWRGELQPAKPNGDAVDRTFILNLLLNKVDQPGFIITDQPGTRHPDEFALGDDEIWWGWELQLSLPDGANAAFEALAQSKIDSYSDAVKIILYSMTVTKSEFLSWCKRKGYYTPSFWSGGTAAQLSKAHSKEKLKKWLKSRFTQSSGTPRKADVWAEANPLFPELSKRAFDRTWAATRPEQGRSGGRPRKRSTG